MKSRVLLIMLAAIAAFGNLYSESYDVSIGGNYENEVYFDLQNGIVKTTAIDEWDFAFGHTLAATVRLNTAKGWEGWHMPNSTVDDWEGPTDTSGMSAQWEKIYNSQEKWGIGAFNMGKVGFETGGDYGWGFYNPQTHFVLGDAVFVLKAPGGAYLKFMIYQLANSVYTIRFSALNGSDEVEFEVNKPADGKNFRYFNLDDAEASDREPFTTEWDLLFSNYTEVIQMGPITMPQNVSGVRHNLATIAAEVETETPESVPAPYINPENQSISIIGYDWKTFKISEGIYEIKDNLVYFVQTQEGLIYRIIFTGFERETGKISFTAEEVEPSSVEFEEGRIAFGIYPNILNPGEDISLALSSDFNAGPAVIEIYSATGALSHIQEIVIEKGLNGLKIDLPGLAPGSYIALLKSGGEISTARFFISG